MMSHFTLLSLPTFGDARGSLSVLDGLLPFDVKRVYWIYGADHNTRGGHRHKETWQALVAIAGQVEILMDDGAVQETVSLSKPDQCLLVEPKDWHQMTFGVGAVLLVLASHPFDRDDYIEQCYE